MNYKYFSLIALVVGFSMSSLAADRALLIGVGNFKDTRLVPLPGIQLDLEMMKDICRELGIQEIKVLADAQATRSNIIDNVNQWLIKGVNPGDRALLYYSGHGMPIPDQNGEEDDKFDECLIPYDVTINSDGTFQNLLIDDDFNTLIRRIPTRWTWVVVDACNSGTISKSLNSNEYVTKSVPYSATVNEMARVARRNTRGGTRGFAVEQTGDPRFVSFSAAEDHEQAKASPHGSLFTLALHALIKDAAGKKQVTFTELKENVSGIIKKVANGKFSQTPVLSGDSEGFQANLFNVKSSRTGQNWEWFHWLAAEAQYPLKIKANKTNFKLGEYLELQLDGVPQEGYLNIVTIDAKDHMTLLFPNKFELENKVNKGQKITIPPSSSNFQLPAVEPLGTAMVIAIHTEFPLSFAQAEAISKEQFKSLESKPTQDTAKKVRGFTVQEKKQSNNYGATILYFNITE